MKAHLADGSVLAATGGLALNLVGSVTADQVIQFVGAGLSLGSLAVTWWLSTRKRIADDRRDREREDREERRHQDQLDAMARLDVAIRERRVRELPIDQLKLIGADTEANTQG